MRVRVPNYWPWISNPPCASLISAANLSGGKHSTRNVQQFYPWVSVEFGRFHKGFFAGAAVLGG
jgi:hypothetical protein